MIYLHMAIYVNLKIIENSRDLNMYSFGGITHADYLRYTQKMNVCSNA